MRTPVRAALVAVGVNFVLNLVAVFAWPDGYQHAGMALATVFASLVNALMLWVALSRRIGGDGGGAALSAVARMGLASVVMGWVAYSVNGVVFRVALHAGHADKVAQGEGLVAAIIASLVVYGVAVRLLCAEDVKRVFSGLGRRRGGGGDGGRSAQ
jgi:peptidoglycan biosynthesis protein MviN/MurJ (putative lipid II flippase)